MRNHARNEAPKEGVVPGAFENNGLCNIWRANRVYYEAFKNRELLLDVLVVVERECMSKRRGDESSLK